MTIKTVVTGANGFVGSAIVRELQQRGGFEVLGLCRTTQTSSEPVLAAMGDLAEADFSSFLHGVDAVIHAAARAHIMKDEVTDPLAEYRRINVEGTLNLARQAVSAGVKRFIFISSVKVNGEATVNGKAFHTGSGRCLRPV